MIGIDLVKIQRISAFRERFGDKALKRFLDDTEISLAKSTQSIAGFWAAKEAISKALGVGIGESCGFLDIKIHKDAQNAPYFTLTKHLVDMFGITDTALSITHEADFAIAVASITTTRKSSRPLTHDSTAPDKL